jgi:hypothetical protein
MAMPKRKKEEVLEPITRVASEGADDVDAILARIAEFDKKAKSMRSNVVNTKTHPDNIYFVDIKKIDEENCYIWRRFHGKCLKAAFKSYDKAGYMYVVTGHIDKSDRDKARTTCEHCNERIDPKVALELEAEAKVRYEKRKEAYARKQRVQQAREDEMALLGLL